MSLQLCTLICFIVTLVKEVNNSCWSSAHCIRSGLGAYTEVYPVVAILGEEWMNHSSHNYCSICMTSVECNNNVRPHN